MFDNSGVQASVRAPRLINPGGPILQFTFWEQTSKSRTFTIRPTPSDYKIEKINVIFHTSIKNGTHKK